MLDAGRRAPGCDAARGDLRAERRQPVLHVAAGACLGPPVAQLDRRSPGAGRRRSAHGRGCARGGAARDAYRRYALVVDLRVDRRRSVRAELAYAIAEFSPQTESVAALDELLDARLLHPTDVPRRFRFRHPLVRRAAHEIRRRPAWRRAARTLGPPRGRVAAQGASAAVAAPSQVAAVAASAASAPRSRCCAAGRARAPPERAPAAAARLAARPRLRAAARRRISRAPPGDPDRCSTASRSSAPAAAASRASSRDAAARSTGLRARATTTALRVARSSSACARVRALARAAPRRTATAQSCAALSRSRLPDPGGRPRPRSRAIELALVRAGCVLRRARASSVWVWRGRRGLARTLDVLGAPARGRNGGRAGGRRWLRERRACAAEAGSACGRGGEATVDRAVPTPGVAAAAGGTVSRLGWCGAARRAVRRRRSRHRQRAESR